jgi:anaerobic ribonucleoside-triphosphate reductase activating protein
MDLQKKTLKINTIDYHVDSAAPWKCTELFVQGCFKRCPGCFNNGLLELGSGKSIPIQSLIDELIDRVPYKRVTFSGGEPFIQPREMYWLARILKENGFTILCYSGYTFEEIPHLFGISLLYFIDILVDGPFIKELITPIDREDKFVGSSNQRIINVQESIREDKVILWTEEDTKRIMGGDIIG